MFLLVALFVIMAFPCLQVFVAALGVFAYCSEAASSCNLSFSLDHWPPANFIVDLKDTNSSFLSVSSNGSVSYKGQPFFFRVRNVFGSAPSIRSHVVRLALRPRERAIFLSLFADIPNADPLAYIAMNNVAFPTATARFFISEIVIYFERFYAPPIQIPNFPYLYTHSIIFDYGGYK